MDSALAASAATDQSRSPVRTSSSFPTKSRALLAGADQAGEERAEVPVQPAEDPAADRAAVAAAATEPQRRRTPVSDAWSWASASAWSRTASRGEVPGGDLEGGALARRCQPARTRSASRPVHSKAISDGVEPLGELGDLLGALGDLVAGLLAGDGVHPVA